MKVRQLKSLRSGSSSVEAYVKAVQNGQHVVPSSDGWKVQKDNPKKAPRFLTIKKTQSPMPKKLQLISNPNFQYMEKMAKSERKILMGKMLFRRGVS